MKDKTGSRFGPAFSTGKDRSIDMNPLPVYPPADDIYNKKEYEAEINPDDLLRNKSLNEKEGITNEKDFTEDVSGEDLDIPGAELDDEQENIGSEDEENNYYSLGGDGHNDLEEDKEN